MEHTGTELIPLQTFKERKAVISQQSADITFARQTK
jgi:hypothetical protein